MTRPPYFAQKFVRLMTKTAAAQELGPSVCWMLSVIASQEDAKRYTEPAKWYYEQLMPLCGFNSRKQLSNAIQKAVSLGWLKYTPGCKGKPCYFSVCVPERFLELNPGGCDESTFSSDSELKAELNRNTKRNCKGRTSISIPNPKETRRKRRSAPVPDGVDPEDWQSWKSVRTAKRHVWPPPEKLMREIAEEAAKAEITLSAAIQFAVKKSWCSFQASWYEKDRNGHSTQQNPPPPKYKRLGAPS